MNAAQNHASFRRFTPGVFLAALFVIECVWLIWEPIRRLPGYDLPVWSALSALRVTAIGLVALVLWFAVARLAGGRFQFGLRSLVLLTLCVAVPLGCLSREMERARRRKQTDKTIRQFGGSIDSIRDFFREPNPPPEWISAVLGSDMFAERIEPEIEFKGPRFTDNECRMWSDYPKTGSVRLYETRVTELGLRRLAELNHLRRLHIRNTPIGDEGVEVLARLSGLEVLELDGVQMTDRGLSALGGLRSLGALIVTRAPITDEGVAELRGLTNLSNLTITHTAIHGRSFARLRGLQRLRSLDLADSEVNDEGLRAISQLTAVESLDLAGTFITDDGLESLANLTNLKLLTLSRTKITDRGLLTLAAVPQLSMLHIANTPTTHEGCLRLKENLPQCTIYPPAKSAE